MTDVAVGPTSSCCPGGSGCDVQRSVYAKHDFVRDKDVGFSEIVTSSGK